MNPPSRPHKDGKGTVYPISDRNGALVAHHVRLDETGGGKTFQWWREGKPSLGGLKRDDLPLYASEVLPSDVRVIFVTEGEKATDALLRIGINAVGTVTGASGCPSVDVLRTLTVGGPRFVLWPDNDDAGRAHMDRVGAALRDAGATDIKVVRYQPEVAAAQWPSGADAHDVIAPLEGYEDGGLIARSFVKTIVHEWTETLPQPLAQPRERPEAMFVLSRPMSEMVGRYTSVSEALGRCYGISAGPGKNVRCPMHDDRHASLHILPDDERAVCHAPTCDWAGRGVIAVDVERSAS